MDVWDSWDFKDIRCSEGFRPDFKAFMSGFMDFSDFTSGFMDLRPGFRDFTSDFKVFRPDSWNFTSDFKDFTSDFNEFRNSTPDLRYFRSDFKDYRNFRENMDFRDFRSNFRTFVHRISELVCPRLICSGIFRNPNSRLFFEYGKFILIF